MSISWSAGRTAVTEKKPKCLICMEVDDAYNDALVKEYQRANAFSKSIKVGDLIEDYSRNRGQLKPYIYLVTATKIKGITAGSFASFTDYNEVEMFDLTEQTSKTFSDIEFRYGTWTIVQSVLPQIDIFKGSAKIPVANFGAKKEKKEK